MSKDDVSIFDVTFIFPFAIIDYYIENSSWEIHQDEIDREIIGIVEYLGKRIDISTMEHAYELAHEVSSSVKTDIYGKNIYFIDNKKFIKRYFPLFLDPCIRFRLRVIRYLPKFDDIYFVTMIIVIYLVVNNDSLEIKRGEFEDMFIKIMSKKVRNLDDKMIQLANHYIEAMSNETKRGNDPKDDIYILDYKRLYSNFYDIMHACVESVVGKIEQ